MTDPGSKRTCICRSISASIFRILEPRPLYREQRKRKSKEVFAYLVHRHGSSCTTRELDAGAVNAYETEYMNQYPWADFLYNGY
ncbi:MAG: hypothetical protein IJ820_01990 [Lachnospiraceae bacterium]|nr:hypothetical protein [Lachnospiraceae bacterium]